ncbi:MAG: M15 family metallopeptidase [Solibacillus sp.]
MKKLLYLLILAFIGYHFLFSDSSDFDKTLSLEQISLYQGHLILVNKETKLQEDPTNLAPIPRDIAANVLVDGDYLLDARALKSLGNLFEAAQRDGVMHFTINSAYRSGKLQQQLYEKSGAGFALPSGYSEHQSGLALDIGSTQGTMDNTVEGDWLAQNAHEYGFILRYPEHKTAITRISFEPWHFRYVGLPHSVMMQKKDFVLEEYLQFLQQEEYYEMKVDEIAYVVQYAQGTTAKVPDTQSLRISGNNKDGYVITSILEE